MVTPSTAISARVGVKSRSSAASSSSMPAWRWDPPGACEPWIGGVGSMRTRYPLLAKDMPRLGWSDGGRITCELELGGGAVGGAWSSNGELRRKGGPHGSKA